MARDAFVESLGDPSLRLRVLERDPETLEQALKLASRLEALRYSDLEDNWDDGGRRKDRFVEVATADETQEIATLMQELKSELKQSRKERERLRRAADGHRVGSEFVVGMTDESVRPIRYFDQPAGGFSAGDWRAPPSTPPTPQQAPPLWDVHSAPSPTTQFTGTAMWAPPQVSSPVGGYYEPTLPSADMHGTSSRRDWSVNGAPLRTPPGNRSSDRCHYCNQKGHWKTECPDRQQRKKAQGAYTQRLGTRTYLNISVAG